MSSVHPHGTGVAIFVGLEFGIWLGDAEPAQADAACDMLAALLRESLD